MINKLQLYLLHKRNDEIEIQPTFVNSIGILNLDYNFLL